MTAAAVLKDEALQDGRCVGEAQTPHGLLDKKRGEKRIVSQVSPKVDLEGIRRKIFRKSHSLNSVLTFERSVAVVERFLVAKSFSLQDALTEDPYRLLDDFIGWLDEQGYRVNTQNVCLQTFRRLYTHHGVFFNKDRFKEEVTRPRPQVFADESLTPETARRILLGVKHHKLRLILSLMKDTAARPEELLSLRLSHFNVTHDPPYLTIPAYASKNDIEREVFFTQETKELLISYLQDHRITDPQRHIFLKGNPDPIGDEKGFQRLVRSAYFQLFAAWQHYRKKESLSRIFKPIEHRGRRAAYNIHIYSFKKYGFTKIADTLGELAAHAIAGHKTYLITYYKKTREQRAEDYRKVAPKLHLLSKPADIEEKLRQIEGEIRSLPPEALTQVLTAVKTVKKTVKES